MNYKNFRITFQSVYKFKSQLLVFNFELTIIINYNYVVQLILFFKFIFCKLILYDRDENRIFIRLIFKLYISSSGSLDKFNSIWFQAKVLD